MASVYNAWMNFSWVYFSSYSVKSKCLRGLSHFLKSGTCFNYGLLQPLIWLNYHEGEILLARIGWEIRRLLIESGCHHLVPLRWQHCYRSCTAGNAGSSMATLTICWLWSSFKQLKASICMWSSFPYWHLLIYSN